MNQIKILSTFIGKVEASKLKSYFKAKFKKENLKNYKLTIESGANFKINGKGNPKLFILVAYIKSEHASPAKPIIKTVAKTVKKATQKVKSTKAKLSKQIFIPIKRFINVNVDNCLPHWVWQFIPSPQKLIA